MTSSQASLAPPAYDDALKHSPYKDPPPFEAVAVLHYSAPPLEDEVPNV